MNANSWMLYGLIALIAIVIIALVAAFVVVYRKKQLKTGDQTAPETFEQPPEKVPVESTAEPEPVEVIPAEKTDSDSAIPATDDTTDEADADSAVSVAAETDTKAIQEVETPESLPSRLQRLRSRMAKSGGFGRTLLSVFSRGDLQASDWEEIEDTLLLADVGMSATEQIIDNLRTAIKVQGTVSASEARELLHKELLALVDPTMDRSLNLAQPSENGQKQPACILVVGVNGTGKTTTVGKIARLLRAENRTVLLGAADTFRAAAAEQLTTWGERVGVEVVFSEKEGADPASVAFEAVKQGISQQVEVVIVDTAGRLQTKSTLMDELGKVKRVMEKQAPVSEVLLVLDATTGQNGMRQAQVFGEVAGVTGIVLTKLDGSAKGGIVISVQKELGVPVKLVGLGEGPDDLAPFVPEDFVNSLLEGALS